MFPTEDANHVAEGLANLTDHYRSKIIIPALTAVYLRRTQEIETVFYQIINGQLLVNSPTGDMLTKIAKLVGVVRDTGDDGQLLAEVKLSIRTLISQGGADDILAVAGIAAQGTGTPVNYYEVPRASWAVEVTNILAALIVAPQSLAHFLFRAKSVGTRGVLIYTTWAPGNDLACDSTYDTTEGQGVLSSVYSSGIGGLLSASAGVI